MTFPLFITGGLAMLPLVELRLAIPFGYIELGLPLWLATVTAIFFNALSVAIVLKLWPIVTRLAAKHWPWFDTVLQKIFAKTRTEHSHKMEIWGEIFLVFFVLIPIPGSGGWMGSVLAFLFGLPYWRSVGLISAGLTLGGLLVAMLSVGGYEIFKVFAGS